MGGPGVVPSDLVHTRLVRGLCLGPNGTHRRPDKVSCPCRWTGNASRSGLPRMVQAVSWMQSQRAGQLLGQGPGLASPMQGGGCGLSRVGLAGQCHGGTALRACPGWRKNTLLELRLETVAKEVTLHLFWNRQALELCTLSLRRAGSGLPVPVSGSPHGSLGCEHIWVTSWASALRVWSALHPCLMSPWSSLAAAAQLEDERRVWETGALHQV